MDIRRWLVETVEQSDEDSHHGSVSHRRHKDDHHYHRPATPSPEEPLEALSRHEQHKKRRHKRKISELRSATAAVSSTSDSSTCSDSSSSSSAPSEHFERRQRHKIRKDLYEPHSGVRKKRTKHDDKADGKAQKRRKKKERQHRRTEKKKRGVKRPGQDFHENFTAKNVRDDRLTLKPQPILGLLKKGRASSPTKPRGLPDLVFSEMQFLKKPRPSIEQSAHVEEITKSDKKRGKKNNKVEEEEVSAYFGAAQTQRPKDREETGARTATPTTSSSKPRSAAVPRTDRAREISARQAATVEDPRRTKSRSPHHTMRSRASNISTLRATSSTAPLIRVPDQAGQLHQAQPDTTSVPDTATPGAAHGESTVNAASPVTTAKDVRPDTICRHNEESGKGPRDDAVKIVDVGSAITKAGPAATLDSTVKPHDSPMAKLLQACQTSVLGPPARPRSHIDDGYSGMGSVEPRQPNYIAGHSERVFQHNAIDHIGVKSFRFAQPKYTDEHAISAPHHLAADHSGMERLVARQSTNRNGDSVKLPRQDMESARARQSNYWSGDSVRLPRPDKMKAIQHAQPQYTVQNAISNRSGIGLMEEPHDGFVEGPGHERSYTARPAQHPSYAAQYPGAHSDHQLHRLDQRQQQQEQQHYHHHRRYDEYLVREPQDQCIAAPIHPPYKPHASEPYEDDLPPQNAYYDETYSAIDRIPKYHNMHAEQCKYHPQPVHEDATYYEAYDDTRQQYTEVYQDYDTGYMVQEQDLYMPTQYESYYDVRDAIDMDMEQQIAQEELIAIEQGEVEKAENEASESLVPENFWRSRKRR